MNFSLIVLEGEGALERSELLSRTCLSTIERKCKITPIESIPIFRPTHAVRHDHDRIGLCVRMRGEYVCVKPLAEDFQFSSAFLEGLLGHSFAYSPGKL